MLRFVLAIASSLCAVAAVAQTSGVMTLEKGIHFMVMFAPVTPSASEEPLPTPLQIVLSSEVVANVRIRTPQGTPSVDAVDVMLNVNPRFGSKTYNAKRVFSLPAGPQKILNNAFEITSDAPITVTTRMMWTGNGEEATHLPVQSLGTAYHAFSMPSDMYGKITKSPRGGFILVAATEDATDVTFKPTVTTMAGPDAPAMKAGQATTIRLEKGQTFYITNAIDTTKIGAASQDLTGSTITSTKPISVVAGHLKGSVFTMSQILPATGATADAHFVRNNIHDVMYPDAYGDTSFIVVPSSYTPRRTYQKPDPSKGITNTWGDVARILALKDFTVVYKLDSAQDKLLFAAVLQRGEYYTDSTVTRPTKYTSTQPVLVMQYAKSWANLVPPVNNEKRGERAEGHPTVEAGMPSMHPIPSIQRWIGSAVFESVQGMDAFVSIAFRTSDVGKILLDGDAFSSLATSITEISNTEFSVYRGPTGPGTHVVSTNDPSVRMMVVPHASLDGMQMGRAFSCSNGINVSAPGIDTIVFASAMPLAENIACGKQSTLVTVRGTTGLYMVYVTSSTNCTSVIAPFAVGDTTTTISVEPINKSLSSDCTFRVVARTGTYAEKRFTYTPDSLAITAPSADVKASLRVPFCFDVKLKSWSPNNIIVRAIRHSSPKTLVGPVPGGQFDIAPLSDTVMQICVTPTALGNVTDTIMIDRSCFQQRVVVLKMNTISPLIVSGDIAFGTMLPTSLPVVKTATITNTSGVILLIDSIAWKTPATDTHFQIDATTPTFPILVAANKSVDVSVRYTPNGDTGTHQATIRVYSNSISADSLIRCTATSSTTVDVAEDADPVITPSLSFSLDEIMHLSFTPNAIVNIYNVQSALVGTIRIPADGRLSSSARALGLSRGLHLFVESRGIAVVIQRILIN